MTNTKLVCIRKPTRKEKKENQAEVVFERKDSTGRKYIIYGAVCHESWEQWGQTQDILWDNVNDITNWRYELDANK